jgi:DNA-directed RNA polymerase subunit alpha
MISPYIKCLKSEKTESGMIFGQFIINSLNPGQGITIGNMLRRVLLGDLGGISITAIRIAGVRDEFSILVGVREDILEILLNLKGIVLQGNIDEPQFGRLKMQGPSVITAKAIQLPSNLKIINPNHYIATISTTNIIEIEFKIEYGKGYQLADQTFSNNLDEFFQTDAIFMPIQKVNFKVDKVYENSKKVSECLILDIWTNGSLLPEEAISQASKIIIKLFNSIIDNNFRNKKDPSNKEDSVTSVDPYTNIAIEELQLSVRAYNCLKRAHINTIGDLLEYSPEQLQQLKNFGRKSADEVFVTLKTKLGIILK